MRRAVALCALTLAAACHTADNPPVPDMLEPAADTYRILNGPATCDGCHTVSFQVAGPDAYDASSAQLEERTTSRRTLPASIQLGRLTGDSGRVLELRVAFLDTVEVGEYDLRLRTIDARGTTEVVVPAALVVTRAFRPGTRPPPIPLGTGPVRVLASVAGQEPDSTFELQACSPIYGCRFYRLRAGVPLDLRLPEEKHVLRLADVSANCEPRIEAVELDVRAGDQLAAVEFVVACASPAYLRIEVNEDGTGTDPYALFELSCTTGTCGFSTATVRTGTVLIVRAGLQGVALTGVAADCGLTDGANRTIDAAASDTVTVTFTILCRSPGVVRVRTQTTGSNPDGTYRMIDLSCDSYYYYFCETTIVEPQTVEYRSYQTLRLQLTDVAANCAVVGDNPAVLTPAPGTVTEHVFQVSCS